MIISERIFKILKEKKMTQKEFAEKVGIGNSTVSEWKKKKTNPSADKIMDICMTLDVTPEQLLTGKGIDEDLDADNCGIQISPIEQKQAQQKRLLAYVEALKQVENLEEL